MLDNLDRRYRRYLVLLAFLAAVAIALYAAQPLWEPRLPHGSDTLAHLYELVQLDHLVRQGVLYSRWMPYKASGFGTPFFHYYAPLAFYAAEGFWLLGAEPVTSLRGDVHRLAVVDLSLGGSDYDNQDGLRVLDAVRRLDPGCVTMLLAGFATVELAVSALTEQGAFTCLRKEAFHRAQFRELVSQALASAPPVGTGMHGSDNASPGYASTGETGEASDKKPPQGLVLVVEDDAGWRSILSELLADAGHQVRLCSSFGQALGCLRREEYALAVVDLSLASSTLTGITLGDQSLSEQELDGYRLLVSTQAAGIPTNCGRSVCPSCCRTAWASPKWCQQWYW